jgi:hypothetical protein
MPRNNRAHRNARPSNESTPPPPQQQQQQQQASQGSGTMYIANDIMVQNIKNFEEVSFVEKSEQAHKQRMMRVRLTKDN